MSWPNFDGKPYTREQFAAKVASLTWTDWMPKGITLHNTAAPTLKQWAESGPSHDARIRNLQSYYENELGWHAGPHLFISRSVINGFSNILRQGVHSRCFNATHIGIECVGDYAVEEWDSGDGAMVRDNAVFAMAVLYRKFNLSPDDLTFHKECKLDNHDCPGRKVSKTDVIARVKAKMAELAGAPKIVPPLTVAPVEPLPFSSGRGSWYSQYDGKYEWVDEGDAPNSAALGVPDDAQGVSFYNHDTLGHWFEVEAPNGVVSTEQQTDIGPHPRTGRKIDISAAAAERFGYSPKNFPTDATFQWRSAPPPVAVADLPPRSQAVQYRDIRKAIA